MRSRYVSREVSTHGSAHMARTDGCILDEWRGEEDKSQKEWSRRGMHLPSGIRHVVLVTFKCPLFARDMHHWLKSQSVADDFVRTMAQIPDAPSPPNLIQKSMKMRHTYVMRRQ